MKKLPTFLILFVAILNFSNVVGQNVLIEYDAYFNSKSYKNEIILNDTTSYWRYAQDDQLAIADNLLDVFIIKSSSQNATFSSVNMFGQTFYIKDTLNNMNWKLTNDKKTILEKECLSATTKFRGREYVAYYSPELLYSNGPWKFGGLPGQILEVKSVDNNYHYKATKIDYQNSEKLDFQKPLKNKFLTWEEYKVSFRATFIKFTKAMRASGAFSDDDQVNIQIDMMEFVDSNSQSKNGYKF